MSAIASQPRLSATLFGSSLAIGKDWEKWVRRIAAAYGVSHDAFLKHTLRHTGRGASDLDRISDAELARLSAGSGVCVERMREMNSTSIQARMNVLQDRPLTEEGSAALDELQVMLSRAARRR